MSTISVPTFERPANRWIERFGYWGGLPFRLWGQFVRNSVDICRVLDLTRLRPLRAGLVGIDHPWVTGINPATQQPIWEANVVYRSPRSDSLAGGPTDREILNANGKFMASRVRKSATLPELPIGPKRRMPHAINYMHGASHYNSGIIILNDLADGFRHLTDPLFRHDVREFVRWEKREVLFLFREKEYNAREYAYLSCCMRTAFRWFCNPNGPQPRVLWGNLAPYAAANLITGHWADDVYQLNQPGGAERVVRPAISRNVYFQNSPYQGDRDAAAWHEILLAQFNDFRIRLRGQRAGMFFVDRREVYADQIRGRLGRGETHDCRENL